MTTSRLAPSLLGGFAVAACVDQITVALIIAPRSPSVSVAVVEVLYAMGHLLFLGLIAAGCGAVATLVSRRIPERWRAIASGLGGAIAAFALGVAAARWLLAVDLSVFEAPLRIAGYAAAGVPFAALVALRRVGPRAWWLAGLHAIVGAGAIAAHPFLLDESYAGLHVFANVIGGAAIGLGIERVARRVADSRFGASLARFLPRAARLTALGVAVAWSWLAAAVPPANTVRMSLSRRPSPTLISFLPKGDTSRWQGTIAPAEVAWFKDRSGFAPIPPTKPALTGEPPIVFFFTIDAFRADALDGSALPRIRRLADKGAKFTMARSPASATSPSIGALLTGKYYSSLFWTTRSIGGKVKYYLPDDDSPRFAELLSSSGVATKLVNTGRGFLPEYGLTRGFEDVSPPVKWAEEAMPHIEQWLDGDVSGGMFVWGHLMDAHAPYDKVAKNGSTKERWFAELATVDAVIGRIEDLITKHDLWSRAYLIVSADHGEAFGEHNTTNHASTIYEELVRIPLVVRGPGIEPKTVIDTPVSLIDLGPTVLDLFQVPTPGTYMGQSLVPLLAGRDVELTRPIVLDTGRRIQAMIGRDGLKVMRNVRAGTFEAYDLNADPGEKENLFGKRDLGGPFGRMDAFFGQHELVKPGYEIPFRD